MCVALGGPSPGSVPVELAHENGPYLIFLPLTPIEIWDVVGRNAGEYC